MPLNSKVLIIMFLESLLVSVSSIFYTSRFGCRRSKHIGQTVFRTVKTVNNTGDNPDMSSSEKLYDGSTNIKYLGYVAVVASVEQAMKLIRDHQ